MEGLRAEVIVSDNGSTDGSLEWIRSDFPRVRILENGANLGFAEANNRAFTIAQGRYILLLNPDTVTHGDAIRAMMGVFEDTPRAGVVGCRLLNADGTRQFSSRSFPSLLTYTAEISGLAHKYPRSRLFGKYNMTYWDGADARTVDWVSGAALMLRREVVDQVGGLDPYFFLTYDEVDLCRRVSAAGYEVWYTPAGEITHLDRQSEPQSNPNPEARIKYLTVERNSRVRYFVKHHGYLYAIAVELLHILLSMGFMLKVFVVGTKRSPVAVMEKRLLLRLYWQTLRRVPRVCWEALTRRNSDGQGRARTPLFVNPYNVDGH